MSSAAVSRVNDRVVISFDALQNARAKTPPKEPETVSLSSDPVPQPDLDPAATAENTPVAAHSSTSVLSTSLMARGRLVSAFARHHGLMLTAQDVSESILRSRRSSLDRGLEEVATYLKDRGLKTRIRAGVAPEDALLPVMCLMTTGQIVMIVEVGDDSVVLLEPENDDNRLEVSLTEFMPYFTGQVLEATGMTLSRRFGRLDRVSPETHWFWGQFRSLRRPMTEIAVGSLVANILAVSVAIFSMQVYDRVIPHQSTPTLWVLAIGAFVAIVMEAMIKMARARLTDQSGRRIELKVQSLLIDRLMGMRSRLAEVAPSRLFAAIREFSSVREFFTANTMGALSDLPFVLLFLLLVWSIGGPVVLILITGGTLMVLPSFLARRKLRRLTEQSQVSSAQSARLLHETIYDLETIKSQRGEARIQRDWALICDLSAASSAAHRRVQTNLTLWAAGVQQATYVAAVIFGAYMTFTGDFTVGTIIAVGILTSRTLAPLTQLATLLAKWSNVAAALDGLDMIASAPQEDSPDRRLLRRERIAGDYALSAVQFGYAAEGPRALSITGLNICAGQRVALIGANGSGKSTLLRMLAGLLPADTGEVRLDGVEIGQIAPQDLRRHIGYMGQEVKLFTGTLRDNLNLNLLESNDERLLQALDFAGLGEMVRGHASGLDMDILDGGRGLSVGQRQSIGWARLWLQNPSVVLLDEPTAAFDQGLENRIIAQLQHWLGHRTVVLATHRGGLLKLVDKIALMHGGRLLRMGARDELLSEITQHQARLSEAQQHVANPLPEPAP